MNPTSKHATKLPDKKTQECLKWARTAGSFATIEMAICVLESLALGDKEHRKAARVLTGYRHLFREMDRTRTGSQWRMLHPDDMPEGVLFPLSEWRNGYHFNAGWGFRRNGLTYSFTTIQSARIALIRRA